jgi:hypothetical protein
MRQAYVTASGMLDMAIAAVDKTSSAAKNFQAIRSKVKRPPEDAGVVPAPVPVPVPIK